MYTFISPWTVRPLDYSFSGFRTPWQLPKPVKPGIYFSKLLMSSSNVLKKCIDLVYLALVYATNKHMAELQREPSCSIVSQLAVISPVLINRCLFTVFVSPVLINRCLFAAFVSPVLINRYLFTVFVSPVLINRYLFTVLSFSDYTPCDTFQTATHDCIRLAGVGQ